MMQRIAPLSLETAGQVATDAIRLYLERRGLPAGNASSGSPWLDITTAIVMAHRYLVRSIEHKGVQRVSADLALSYILEARDGVARLHHARIQRELGSLYNVLGRPVLAESEIKRVAEQLWLISDSTLDLDAGL